MRSSLLLLVPALALTAACASPREVCIREAQAELRTLTRLAADTRANVQRGYALETVQEVRTVTVTCTGTNEDGTTFTFPCEETRTFDRQVPVAIDLDAERAKLASIERRIDEEQAIANARIAQCPLA